MKVLYFILKALVRLILRIFYPKTTIVNPERLDFKHPAIVVSNHPNTMLDAMHSAVSVKKQVFFLANASLFSNAFQNWFFSTFYCIPIKRKQDTKGDQVNNEDSFARCDAFLGNGGCLYIAPEGSSFMERHLREIKTGTARIALSAENKKNFQLGLKILPIGLSYEQPNRFRSAVLINVGKPIDIRDYQKEYQSADFETARKMTDDLAEAMRSVIIDVDSEEEDQLVKQLEAIEQNDRFLPPEVHFLRTKKRIDWLRQLKSGAEETYQALKTQTDDYFQRLKQKNISDRVVAAGQISSQASPWKLLILILGFPLFLYGWINNYLPAKIPAFLVNRLKLYVGYDATVKCISGMLTFPLFYFIQYKLIARWLDAPFPLLYLLSLPLMGWLALRYRTFFKKWREEWRYRFRVSKDQKQALESSRHNISNLLPEISW